MILLKRLSLFIFLIIISCCEQKPDPEYRLNMVDIIVPKEYTINYFDYYSGIGESTEEYELLISQKDYKMIKNQIENLEYFQYHNKEKICKEYIKNKLDSIGLGYGYDERRIAFYYDGEYYFKALLESPVSYIGVKLKKDSTMWIYYWDY